MINFRAIKSLNFLTLTVEQICIHVLPIYSISKYCYVFSKRITETIKNSNKPKTKTKRKQTATKYKVSKIENTRTYLHVSATVSNIF